MHTRPCWVEISTRSLEDNFRFLSALAGPQVELLAIVKADAYGHALKICAPAAVRAGARWLGVTSIEEGVEARRCRPEARILVIGSVFPGQGRDVVRHNPLRSSGTRRNSMNSKPPPVPQTFAPSPSTSRSTVV